MILIQFNLVMVLFKRVLLFGHGRDIWSRTGYCLLAFLFLVRIWSRTGQIFDCLPVILELHIIDDNSFTFFDPKKGPQ